MNSCGGWFHGRRSQFHGGPFLIVSSKFVLFSLFLKLEYNVCCCNLFPSLLLLVTTQNNCWWNVLPPIWSTRVLLHLMVLGLPLLLGEFYFRVSQVVCGSFMTCQFLSLKYVIQVGKILYFLLSTGTELYRERLVRALAQELQVPLLVLDSSVLAPYVRAAHFTPWFHIWYLTWVWSLSFTNWSFFLVIVNYLL